MATTKTVREKVQAWEREASATLVEREDTLRSVLVAALAGEHALLVGPPGEAKSLLARTLVGLLTGASYYELLLTKFTVPEEVFGPLSIAGLKADVFRRVTAGKLSEAHVAFLDEIFKANASILNSLLSVLNERVYNDGTGTKPCPLVTVVAASNELPQGEELSALYDRFLIRCWVKPVKDDSLFLDVVTGARSRAGTSTTITLDEWASARAEVDAMSFGAMAGPSILDLRQKLGAAGIAVSTRRWKKCASLMRAAAWLDGSAEVAPEHLEVLASALWNSPDQEPVVRSLCAGVVSADLVQAREYADAILEVVRTMPAAGTPAFTASAMGVGQKVKEALTKIDACGERASGATTKAKIDALADSVEAAARGIRDAIRAAAEPSRRRA